MWREIVRVLIPAGGGGVVANIIGELHRKFDLGMVGNTISGIIGGVIVGLFAGGAVGSSGADPTAGGLNLGSFVAQVVYGGFGGGALMMTIGLAKALG